MTMTDPMLTTIVYLRNVTGGEVVGEYGPEQNRRQHTWKGHGDPEGGDIQGVERHLLNDPNLRRAMTNGILIQVDEADAERAFQMQAAAYRARTQMNGPGAVAQHLQASPIPEAARVHIDGHGRVSAMPPTPQKAHLANAPIGDGVASGMGVMAAGPGPSDGTGGLVVEMGEDGRPLPRGGAQVMPPVAPGTPGVTVPPVTPVVGLDPGGDVQGVQTLRPTAYDPQGTGIPGVTFDD